MRIAVRIALPIVLLLNALLRITSAQEPSKSVADLMELYASLTVVDGNVVEVRFPPSLKVDVKGAVDSHPLLDTRWADSYIREYGTVRLTGHLAKVLAREPIENNQLNLLKGLKTVILVDARFSNITDESLDLLQNLWLEHLDISATRITGQGLSDFRGCEVLRTLFAAGLLIDDSTFLEKCNNLEVLNLTATKLDAQAIERIAKLRSLRDLCLRGVPIKDEDVRQLALIQQLEHLDLADTQITSAALLMLAGHPRLRHLNISANIPADEIQKFKEQAPAVRVTIRNDGDPMVLPIMKRPEN
jgi:hypothetical protein